MGCFSYLTDEMRQDVDSPSPDILIETVVAAGMILKQYGKQKVVHTSF